MQPDKPNFEKWVSPCGRATLYRGDCLEIMPTLPVGSVDACVTDPPFAITGGLSNGMTSRNDTQFFKYWFSDVSRGIIRTLNPAGCMFLWCDWRTLSAFDESICKASEQYNPWWISQVITHDREMIGMGSPFRNQCDWIALVRGKKTQFGERIQNNTPNIIRSYSYYGKHKHHPAEKTVEVAKKIVKWASDEGQIVSDWFMGGGTVGVAAIETGRRFIGCEMDEAHFATAKARIIAALADRDSELPFVEPADVDANQLDLITLAQEATE